SSFSQRDPVVLRARRVVSWIISLVGAGLQRATYWATDFVLAGAGRRLVPNDRNSQSASGGHPAHRLPPLLLDRLGGRGQRARGRPRSDGTVHHPSRATLSFPEPRSTEL